MNKTRSVANRSGIQPSLAEKLSTRQRAKIVALAAAAFAERLRVRGLLTVRETQFAFLKSLTEERKRASSELDRLHPREADHTRAKYVRRLAELDEKVAAARLELDKVSSSAREASASFSAPTNALLTRILERARITRAELGIAFEEPVDSRLKELLDPNAIGRQ